MCSCPAGDVVGDADQPPRRRLAVPTADERRGQLGELFYPLLGERKRALGELEHRALLFKGERYGRRARRGGRYVLVRLDLLRLVHHYGGGREVAQALEVAAGEHRYQAHAVKERQEVDLAQEVARKRGGPAHRRPAFIEPRLPYDPFARRLAAPGGLEPCRKQPFD